MSAAPLLEHETPRLVDLLLEQQQSLSAVERFAQKHAAAELPLQARYYRDLIPSRLPGRDQQYAFRVDLDACTGCKACVTACHGLNGLDWDESWRDIGLVVGSADDQPVLQTVTTTCHHCEDPGCLAGCPVQAYEKDPVTGIVRHLDDQCIGCQYCILKCPYDVPKYNARRGIVRKCDMCHGRLAAGEAPACVQGCPNQAISIRVVDRGQRPQMLLPLEADGMPPSTITRPTTRYVSRRLRHATLRAADHETVEPADAHTPLAIMLVAVQLSVGLLCVERVAGSLGRGGADTTLQTLAALLAAGLALAGQAAALLHLGRPRYAFRAILGWRTSWMSREILAFGGFAAAVSGYAASLCLAPLAAASGVPAIAIDRLCAGLGVAALGLGLVGTFCSVMIYADTHREFWSFRRTAFRFFGSAALLGPAALLVCALQSDVLGQGATSASGSLCALLCGAVVLATAVKLAGETRALRHLGDGPFSTLARSAALVLGPLRPVWLARIATGLVGGVLLPLGLLVAGGVSSGAAAGVALSALLLLFTGELLERRLYFRAVASRAMPGQA